MLAGQSWQCLYTDFTPAGATVVVTFDIKILAAPTLGTTFGFNMVTYLTDPNSGNQSTYARVLGGSSSWVRGYGRLRRYGRHRRHGARLVGDAGGVRQPARHGRAVSVCDRLADRAGRRRVAPDAGAVVEAAALVSRWRARPCARGWWPARAATVATGRRGQRCRGSTRRLGPDASGLREDR